MKTIDLKELFQKINYDYFSDKEKIEKICFYTKTRVKADLAEEISLTRGMEQPFFVKSIVDWTQAKKFFEIGTGRGTASYSVSLSPSVEKIITIDIVPHAQKKEQAIGFKSAYVSNEDLYKLIPYEEKQKISFKQRGDLPVLLEKEEKYDVCFIDGNHSDPAVIFEDYVICKKIMKEDGIIIWDDYEQDKFAIKTVVDHVLKSDKDLDAVLVEFRGHLFESENKEKNSGMVIMRKGKLF